VGALAILVLSVAAIDSLNPSTVVPAAVLALGKRPALRVGLFTLGVFVISTAGGLVLLFAVGRSVIARFAHPSPHTEHVFELGIGVALLLVAGVLWILRDRLRAHLGRVNTTGGRSAFLLGAGIMAIELPTAFPYFAAILATLGAVHGAVQQTVFILLYNLVFVAPLFALTLFVAVTGNRYWDRINRVSMLIRIHGPDFLPLGIAIIGGALVVIGIHGL